MEEKNINKIEIGTSANFNIILSVVAITTGISIFLFFSILTLALEFNFKIKFSFILIAIFGLYLIIKGTIYMKFIKRLVNYIKLFSISDDLNYIALQKNKKVDFIMKDIQNMINKKLLINVIIDRDNKKILIK